MRAQLSLEFMVYMAAGMASLVMVLAAAGPALHAINRSSADSYIGALVAEINANAAYARSTFAAYVPKGICSASINQSAIKYANSVYTFSGDINGAGDLCAYAGSVRDIELVRVQNGTFILRVVG
ncbi:MAG: hypothetical protein ACP5UH_01755 [Candidatus Micrarchaeia archaeon]